MAPLWLDENHGVNCGQSREGAFDKGFGVVADFGIVLAVSKDNQKISFLLKKADRLAP